MERATKDGIMVAGPTLDLIPQNDLDVSGVVAKRARRPAIPSKLSGIPLEPGDPSPRN